MLSADVSINRTGAFWMPFTPMRAFRDRPNTFVSAEGLHYVTSEGRRILDGMAGLWCVNAGHGHPLIVDAICSSVRELDFVSSFRMTHPAADTFATQLTGLAPAGIDHAFFTNSGSEAVDTALKIARAYHWARGEGGRSKLVGRQKAYHGVGFGGLAVSGLARHKVGFGPLVPDTAHLPLPYDPSMRFSPAPQPGGEAHADALQALLAIHAPETVAAVIVEPVVGSGGVYPPPQGYLRRLREICDRHGILLIFDEVITGFGRLGAAFAAERYGVTPDLMTCAKGLTNGSVPMGAVLVRDHVYDAFMTGPPEAIELAHGYTYSAHPLGCAAGIATIAAHRELGINEHVRTIEPHWTERAHALKGLDHVTDIRTAGILCAVDLAPRAGARVSRAAECAERSLDAGVLIRAAGDSLVLSPPLIIDPEGIDLIFGTIADILRDLD